MKTDNIGTGDRVTFLATCVKLTRKDGVIMGFTDYARDLVIDGITYEAKSGYSATTVTSSSGLAVDNLDIEGALSSESITEADLTAGKYNFAEIEIFQVDYTKPQAGKNILKAGTLGQVSRGDNAFKAEIRGLAQMAQRNIGELYSEDCRADLGDSRCKVNMTPYTHTGSITAVGEKTLTLNINKPTDYFSHGIIIGLTGANTGVRMEIVEHTNTSGSDVITTFLPLPYAVAIGDTFKLQAGCNRKIVTCRTRFNNYLNFRAEPGIPGTDKIITYAVHK